MLEAGYYWCKVHRQEYTSTEILRFTRAAGLNTPSRWESFNGRLVQDHQVKVTEGPLMTSGINELSADEQAADESRRMRERHELLDHAVRMAIKHDRMVTEYGYYTSEAKQEARERIPKLQELLRTMARDREREAYAVMSQVSTIHASQGALT